MNAPLPHIPQQPTESVVVLPVVVWLVIQLLSLSIIAARVPLWARPPHPDEGIATRQMLVVQVIAPALLFGWLIPNATTGVVVILTSGPMLQLSGMLAQVPIGRIALTWGMLCIWLAGLTCWSATLRDIPQRLIACAVATMLALGMPMVRYLADENGMAGVGASFWRSIDLTGAILLATEPGRKVGWSMIPLLMVLIGGVMVLVIRHRSFATGYPQV